MNAHINHDLPLAVVAACADLATVPTAGTHLADYQKVDALLDAAEQSVRQSFETGPELAIDRHLRAVEDLVCGWTIKRRPRPRLGQFLLLWQLRDAPFARGLFPRQPGPFRWRWLAACCSSRCDSAQGRQARLRAGAANSTSTTVRPLAARSAVMDVARYSARWACRKLKQPVAGRRRG